MRIVLAGTDLAPVWPGAGALETLLWGWAEALGAAGPPGPGALGGHDVHVASFVADEGRGDRDAPVLGFTRHHLDRPDDLAGLTDRLAPDAVVLNNRPAWQRWVPVPTLHLLHNWPDAWALRTGERPDIGGAAAAAVSDALAAAATGILATTVGVVRPFVGEAFLAVTPAPRPELVLAPNRLMAKKGVAELVAASAQAALEGRRILVTDFLSPWTAPTEEHRRLRALVVAAPRCELIPPPPTRAGVAALYATAGAVVVPSVRPEGLGMTAVEAQAAGVPVVTSGLGGLAEVTLAPGRVADPHDPAALAAAIAGVAGTGPDGRAGLRARIAARYSLTVSVASLLRAVEGARPPA